MPSCISTSGMAIELPILVDRSRVQSILLHHILKILILFIIGCLTNRQPLSIHFFSSHILLSFLRHILWINIFELYPVCSLFCLLRISGGLSSFILIYMCSSILVILLVFSHFYILIHSKLRWKLRFEFGWWILARIRFIFD